MAQLDHKHDNPLNSSSSKHQYSFSKTNRFNFHAKTEVPDHFYEVPSTRQQLSFSFGKSLRSDFTKHEKTSQSPPPNSYHFEGDIEKLLKKKEGVRILYGREVRDRRFSNASRATSSSTATTRGPGCTIPTLRLQLRNYAEK